MSIALREGVQRLEVTLRVTLAVRARSGVMEMPKEKLYSFKRDDSRTRKLVTETGAASTEPAKTKG